MPGESTKKQREADQKHGEHTGQAGSQDHRSQQREQDSTQGRSVPQSGQNNQQGGRESVSQHVGGGRRGGSLGQRGTQQTGQSGSNRGESENETSDQVGGPGPHGSSDPETNERNKNKPLTDDWGKGDKH